MNSTSADNLFVRADSHSRPNLSIVANANTNKMVKHAQRHITKGNSVETQQKMLDEEIMLRSFDEGDNKQKDYMRITHFDKSNAFGFGKKEDYNLG